MAKKYEKIILYVIIVFAAIIAGLFILDINGPAPEVAMEKYLEKKYDEDVTCISCEYESGGSYMVPSAGWYEGEFISNKHPDLEFVCSAQSDDGIWKYKFTDNYQAKKYLPDVQKIMEEAAEKYFEGEYYIVLDTYKEDPDSVGIMSFEECVKRYDWYRGYIYVYDSPAEDACDAMQKFVTDMETQGFHYTFYMGRNITNDKEIFIEFVNGEDINWYDVVEWLFYKNLPPKEGEGEPDVFLITEE